LKFSKKTKKKNKNNYQTILVLIWAESSVSLSLWLLFLLYFSLRHVSALFVCLQYSI